MKRILTIIVLAAACTSAFAQKAPRSASYSELKNYYLASDYVADENDPYSVGWICFDSFVVPGMGQLIMKERGHGWAFLGSSIVLGAISELFADGIRRSVEFDDNDEIHIVDGKRQQFKKNLIGLACFGLAELGVSIWSCIDANRIAKVKNQYYQDVRGKHAFSATVYPSFDLAQTGTSVVPTAGMTFAVRF